MNIRRLPIHITGDVRRVIARPFILNAARVEAVMCRVDALDEPTVMDVLGRVQRDFLTRHRMTDAIFEEHYRAAATMVGWKKEWSRERRLLAGAYFTMEYSVDSAALFNPSIVLHPDQSNVPPGSLRFVMSLRATGEGHVSSVMFRTGIITADQNVEMDSPPSIYHRARVIPDRRFEKALFQQKLSEVGVDSQVVNIVLERVGDYFTLAELSAAINQSHPALKAIAGSTEAVRNLHWLASSNYHISLGTGASLSELVIFPMSEDDSHGIEDVRMVRFVDTNGEICYYGTYTAYNGVNTLPMMMRTHDFKHVEVHSLNGAGAANKGLALFPRRINGKYVMCSRIDGENLYISTSDSAYFWASATRLAVPRYPWEFMQIGNCGSPLETEAGWLLLTHGVGPMRSYAIGAVLLDRDDPLKVLGALSEPLITPTDEEREGYVPNVVYTCGAIINNGDLFVPYAQADRSISVAVVDLNELMGELLNHRQKPSVTTNARVAITSPPVA